MRYASYLHDVLLRDLSGFGPDSSHPCCWFKVVQVGGPKKRKTLIDSKLSTRIEAAQAQSALETRLLGFARELVHPDT